MEHVRRAATQLATRPAPLRAGGFVGAPTRLVVEREVPGELPASALEVVIDVLRRHVGSEGRVVTTGRTLMWTVETLSTVITVSVSPRFGRTSIHVDNRLRDLAAEVFAIAGAGGLVAGGLGVIALMGTGVMGPIAAGGLGALSMGAPYLLARGIYRRKVDTTEQELHDLADVVAACVVEAVAAEGAREGG